MMRPLGKVGPINHPLLCGNSYSDGKLNLATARSADCGHSYSRATRIPAWDGWMDNGRWIKAKTSDLYSLPLSNQKHCLLSFNNFDARDQAEILRTAFNKRRDP